MQMRYASLLDNCYACCRLGTHFASYAGQKIEFETWVRYLRSSIPLPTNQETWEHCDLPQQSPAAEGYYLILQVPYGIS